MKKVNNGRRVSPDKLRWALGEMVDAICSGTDRPILVMAGNSFEIHLEEAVVNIAFHERRPRKHRKSENPKNETR